ncbi:MAG: ABC transporter permease [Clostridium sp.]|nr:ABC transporter permease [Clostridium sp.]
MVFDIDNWKEITATLARNKTRTFLTAFGIFWGTAMLALLMGGGKGLRGLMESTFSGFASNSAILISYRTTMPYNGYKKGMRWNMTTTDIDNMRRAIPELSAVSPMTSVWTTISYGSRSQSNVSIQGVEPNFMEVTNPVIRSGRFINDKDIAQDAKVCVLGKNCANGLFGDDDPIGKFVMANNVYYRVVGVVKQRNDMSIGGSTDDSMFIPMSTARRTYNRGNIVDYVTIVAKDNVKISDLKQKIFRVMRASHPLHPDDENALRVIDLSEMFEQVGALFSGIDILILFVGLSSLIAGIIGVGNIMWIIVKERTKEFGIRRALGAKPRMVMEQILSESAILTLIAGTAGICFAVGILGLVTMSIRTANAGVPQLEDIDFQLSFSLAVGIAILFIVLGMAAGTIPAFKAMRIKPIEAMNDK